MTSDRLCGRAFETIGCHCSVVSAGKRNNASAEEHRELSLELMGRIRVVRGQRGTTNCEACIVVVVCEDFNTKSA